MVLSPPDDEMPRRCCGWGGALCAALAAAARVYLCGSGCWGCGECRRGLAFGTALDCVHRQVLPAAAERAQAHVLFMAVADGQRGRGCARRLLLSAMEQARAASAGRAEGRGPELQFFLETTAERGVEFYQRAAGFRVQGECSVGQEGEPDAYRAWLMSSAEAEAAATAERSV